MNLHFIYGTVGRFEDKWGRTAIEGHSKLTPLSQGSDGSELIKFWGFIFSHMIVHVLLIPTWNEKCFGRIHKYILGGYLEIEIKMKRVKNNCWIFFALFTNALSFYRSKMILSCPNCFGQVQIVLVRSKLFWLGPNHFGRSGSN